MSVIEILSSDDSPMTDEEGSRPTSDQSEAIDPSGWTVLPNGRLGKAMPSRKDGVQVYLAVDGRTRLCKHGESHSFINKWKDCPHERPVGSICDCRNCDGLTATRRAKAPKDWHAPSYYAVLCALGCEEIEIQGGRKARKIPNTDSKSAAFMLPSGAIRCRHGNSESTLKSIQKGNERALRKCDCVTGDRCWRRPRLGTMRCKRGL